MKEQIGDMTIKYNQKINKEKNDKIQSNDRLLSLLFIRGQYAEYNSHFSNAEIYIALVKAKHYLASLDDSFFTKRLLSERQMFCSNFSMRLIMKCEYNHALHEFMDCIDDFGEGKCRKISVYEYALYSCIIDCFINHIENNSENVRILRELAYKVIKDEFLSL